MSANEKMSQQCCDKPVVIGIIVGEHSGDTLGAGMMSSLLQRFPNAKFVGIGGPKMEALGFQSLFAMEELAVMGVFEVLGRLPRLLHIRKHIVNFFKDNPPDVFVGIDAPDFNLPVEHKLKAEGIKTVHYVSPSVWAWREKRIFKIAKATNMVLSLLPFEKAFYDKHQVPCTFVGHPLADDIPLVSDKKRARESLGLAKSDKILAIMPGSRSGELMRLCKPFLETAIRLQAKHPELKFVAPMISDKRATQFKALVQEFAPTLDVSVIVNQTQAVMAASDCLLMASGTVTLEAALVKRPMVVCYRFNSLTYHMFKGFVKLKWFSLPNLLANSELVPELLQSAVTVENILPLVEQRLFEEQQSLNESFTSIHLQLKQDASEKAAQAVEELVLERVS
ncbi:lipid-A-disaccharide synthase [Thalassotalea fusca]